MIMERRGDIMAGEMERLMGKDAQRNNILAAKTVSDIVKTTLGPKGMDKMLVTPSGEIIVTNDGVTILSEMQIEHPAAKMMVEIAKTQEDEVGDGTTSSVMIAGKLLENAEKMLDQKIHPTIIVKGYRMAQEKAQEILKEGALQITPENEEVLRQVAMTAMTGKGAEDSKEKLADILVKAVKAVKSNDLVDLKDIKVEKVSGDSINDTELISGIVLDKARLSKDMPRIVGKAKILLVDFPIELKSPEIDTKISINSHIELQNFLGEEERAMKEMIDKVVETEANVLFCQKGIDDYAQYLLAKKGIYACRRVPKSDLEKLSKATGAKIISGINDITSYELGEAEEVEEVKHSGDIMTYVRGCKNPKAVTILIHGGTSHVLDEIERALMDGLGDIVSALDTKLVVPGGGAIEIELSRRIRSFAKGLKGRERIAVYEFANSLEFIPATLSENAGLDPIDMITEMKRRHDAGDKNAGLNLFENKVDNVLNAKIIEPYKVKSQAVNSATDVATMILRIDDVIAARPRARDSSEKGMMSNYMNSRE
jgi:thermosome